VGDKEVSEMWRDHKEESQNRRASNREQSAQVLLKEGIEFDSNNGGAHLIVTDDNGTIDFWPGTGRWKTRGGITGFGVYKLIKHIRKNS